MYIFAAKLGRMPQIDPKIPLQTFHEVFPEGHPLLIDSSETIDPQWYVLLDRFFDRSEKLSPDSTLSDMKISVYVRLHSAPPFAQEE